MGLDKRNHPSVRYWEELFRFYDQELKMALM